MQIYFKNANQFINDNVINKSISQNNDNNMQ
jgi:hypothetical protein